jgi:hypothetical protein
MALGHHPCIHDPGIQIRPNQPDHPGIIDAPFEPVDQDVVVDPVKEFGQVDVHHHSFARLDVRPRGFDRVVRTPARPKPVAVFAEGGIEQRLQHLQQSAPPPAGHRCLPVALPTLCAGAQEAGRRLRRWQDHSRLHRLLRLPAQVAPASDA